MPLCADYAEPCSRERTRVRVRDSREGLLSQGPSKMRGERAICGQAEAVVHSDLRGHCRRSIPAGACLRYGVQPPAWRAPQNEARKMI
jgi:hypothetical protein